MSFEEQRPERQGTTTTGEDDALRCVRCDHRITDRSYRCEQGGAHEHVFVNAAGYTYTIGCFVAAPGCGHRGPSEEAFTWFPGWAWQIAVCGSCNAHVGWIYRLAGSQFHGLILAALR